MTTRPLVTVALLFVAGVAVAAAPRLMPAASAPVVADEAPVAEVTEVAAVDEESPLDQRDAVAEVVEEPARPTAPAEPPARPKPQRDVDLVIALDTSGSMEGLLDSARARLWDVVNAAAEKDPDARVRVALITFGSPGVAGPQEGFVKVRSDLTTDLDSLYGQVMALHTDGGEEYVGWTLDTAVNQLSWSRQANAARIIFVAGNESADQGRDVKDFRTVSAQARERGILINAMFAGNAEQGHRERWSEVAQAGGGVYSAIDQAAGTYQVATPLDQELADLNTRLNGTYVGYGERGSEGKDNQVRQDANAMSMGMGSLGSRVAAKSKNAYDNASWDVVDAVQSGRLDVAAAPAAALPAPMQSLSAEERKQYVEELAEEREKLKREIDEVSRKRAEYVEAAAPDADGLDDAILEAIDEQL